MSASSERAPLLKLTKQNPSRLVDLLRGGTFELTDLIAGGRATLEVQPGGQLAQLRFEGELLSSVYGEAGLASMYAPLGDPDTVVLNFVLSLADGFRTVCTLELRGGKHLSEDERKRFRFCGATTTRDGEYLGTLLEKRTTVAPQ